MESRQLAGRARVTGQFLQVVRAVLLMPPTSHMFAMPSGPLLCCVLQCYLQLRLVRQALGLARLQPGDQVLDVACGRGKSSHMASHRVGISGRVLGLDLLPQVGWPPTWQVVRGIDMEAS